MTGRVALGMLLLVGGCYLGGGNGASPLLVPPGADAAPSALVVVPVAWNPGAVPVGHVQAVADADTNTVVFGDTGVTLLENGSLVASDATVVSWQSAASIPAPSGGGSAFVGVDGMGHLRLIHTTGAPEDVSDRYGLLSDTVQDLAAAGNATGVGFLLSGALAVADGMNVTRYPVPATAVAGGAGRVAFVADGVVRVLDMTGASELDLALGDAAFVAFDAAGTLYAASHHAVYTGDAKGQLALVFDAQGKTLHGLVSCGANVWAAVDTELALVGTTQTALSSSTPIAADARLFGSPSGDVWALSGGTLTRFAASSVQSDETLWTQTVQPIFASVCSNCHSAPGSGKDSSNFDLSTYDKWAKLRTIVLQRVVADEGQSTAMPPPASGVTLTAAQRMAIGAWASPAGAADAGPGGG